MASELITWSTFESQAPDIAAAGRRLLGGGDGQAIAYLATVRADGGPRVHPVMPVLSARGLYVFVVNLSWKYGDLLRDGRYALHTSAGESSGEEFYVTGAARELAGEEVRQQIRDASDGRLGGHEFEVLFEFGIDRALHTKWENWGTASTWPTFAKWPAGG